MKLELDDKREAIIAASGHVLVTGGPGSGKTTIALLKARNRSRSLKPGQAILFLSFSRAAVRQIVTRCKEVLSVEERRRIEVKTYHLFCLETLAAHGRLLSGRAIGFLYPGDERLRNAEFGGDWERERHRLAKKHGIYCFDLVAGAVAELLAQSRAVRSLFADKYPLVIVDEFQDTDDDQWGIVRAFLEAMDVVCLADPDQRIFEYRANVDPQRVEKLEADFSPTRFDLGGDNHRSPSGGILGFADAVLLNRYPLPRVAEVSNRSYYPRGFEPAVHAAVVWMFSALRRSGIEQPSVAVLARSNAFVAQLSSVLAQEHKFKSQSLPPVEHDVLWDADLSSAAAQVVGSILEWTFKDRATGVHDSARAIANYYRVKNAGAPSKAAAANSQKFDAAADAIRDGRIPRCKAVKELLSLSPEDVEFSGSPVDDWRKTLRVLETATSLAELFREARMVRMFRVTDTLGAGLAALWLERGNYGGAADLVKRVLDRERLLAGDRDHAGCLLMNIHRAKGKEFDGVVLVEGQYVSRFFDTNKEQPPYQRSRRLLRVAITRARHRVGILRPHDAVPLVVG